MEEDSSAVDAINEQLKAQKRILAELKENLEIAQAQMQTQANKHGGDVEFEGDLVYLKLQPYKQKSLAKKMNKKLSPRYYRVRTLKGSKEDRCRSL